MVMKNTFKFIEHKFNNNRNTISNNDINSLSRNNREEIDTTIT